MPANDADLESAPEEFRVAGPGGPICNVALDAASTLSDLKDAIEASVGIPAVSQRLFCGLQELVGAPMKLAGLLPVGDDCVREELLLVRRSREESALMETIGHLLGHEVLSWVATGPREVRAHKEMVLAFVSKNGAALAYASKSLREDRDVVLTAIADDGTALEYASPKLRADKDIVIAAVTQDGRAIMSTTPQLRADPDVKRVAYK